MRSASVIASCRSCVTIRVVMPFSACRRAIKSRISSRRDGSRLESGSSSNQTRGSVTRARASATRCCCPPESCPTRLPPEPRELHLRERRRHARVDHGARLAAHPQPETDIRRDIEMREERRLLEDHHRAAPLGRDTDDRDAIEADIARVRLDQPRDHPQRRRLPAAGRAEQCDERARLDAQGRGRRPPICRRRPCRARRVRARPQARDLLGDHRDRDHRRAPTAACRPRSRRVASTSVTIAGATKSRASAAAIGLSPLRVKV